MKSRLVYINYINYSLEARKPMSMINGAISTSRLRSPLTYWGIGDLLTGNSAVCQAKSYKDVALKQFWLAYKYVIKER